MFEELLLKHRVRFIRSHAGPQEKDDAPVRAPRQRDGGSSDLMDHLKGWVLHGDTYGFQRVLTFLKRLLEGDDPRRSPFPCDFYGNLKAQQGLAPAEGANRQDCASAHSSCLCLQRDAIAGIRLAGVV